MKQQTRDKILRRVAQTSAPTPTDLTRLRARLSEMARENPPPDYSRYIRSRTWREKRAQILAHYNHRCAICGSPKNLQVHHLHYQSVGDEQMDDVAVCCKRCHFKLHLPHNQDPDWAGSRAAIVNKPVEKQRGKSGRRSQG